jgi:aspartate carbamoyltransferase catalytic subunit
MEGIQELAQLHMPCAQPDVMMMLTVQQERFAMLVQTMQTKSNYVGRQQRAIP